jgi:hypothetical protein
MLEIGLWEKRESHPNCFLDAGHYGKKLAKVMNKMLLVSEVAGLAKEIERAANHRSIAFPVPSE